MLTWIYRPLEAAIFGLVVSSQDGGIATKSAPVCLRRLLLLLDSFEHEVSIETARA